MQIMVVAGVFLAVGFLAANAVENLELLGKSFGFNFLWEPASYDINQSFIEYNSRDTHFRAAVVGLINTAVVAVAGGRFASILVFLFGVLRLLVTYTAITSVRARRGSSVYTSLFP